MKIIQSSFEIVNPPNMTRKDGLAMLKHIEAAGRTCYKSEDKIAEDSAEKFIHMISKRGHESVIEHGVISVRIVCDRGVSHEIVRHRLASYSQESTRYCNYSKDKHSGEVTFIRPCFWGHGAPPQLYEAWENSMLEAERCYLYLLANGAKPEEARSVLPNSLKTEIVMTCNLREWRHFFKLRTGKAAHPQMLEIAVPMLRKFRELVPVIFDDVGTTE